MDEWKGLEASLRFAIHALLSMACTSDAQTWRPESHLNLSLYACLPWHNIGEDHKLLDVHNLNTSIAKDPAACGQASEARHSRSYRHGPGLIVKPLI